MKRLFKVLVILSIAVLFISCGRKVTSEEAEEKIKERINSLNKGKYDDSDYVNLLFVHIYSPKYIESKGWNKSNRSELYEEVKEYNVIEDINFKLEWW